MLQGWPDSYFRDPLVEDDKSDGIFWWGVDTTKPQNSAPGHHEQAGSGCCHERDRHTRMEPTALDYVLRYVLMLLSDIFLDGSCQALAQASGCACLHGPLACCLLSSVTFLLLGLLVLLTISLMH